MVNTVCGSPTKPVSAGQLAETLSREERFEGTLYIGYPIIGTPEGPFLIDALLVLRDKGLVLFDLVEGRELQWDQCKDQQDEAFTKMQAKLLQHQSLIHKRKLKAQIHTVTFAPVVSKFTLENHQDGEHSLCNADTLVAEIKRLEGQDSDVHEPLVAVIQAISTLRHGRKKRNLQKPQSRGSKLKKLENSIANLDMQQSRAVIETFDGVQRIRGLAGSGKTIVLALKAAYLHARHPDWDIAVTFYTRSLKGQFESLIRAFVLEQTNEEPDWEKVRILNAWGAAGGKDRSGVYFEFCKDHGVEYSDFRAASSMFGNDRAFEGACDHALQKVQKVVPKYHAMLVDEAQDFFPNFLLLCYKFLREPKRLVYAYDELQNLSLRFLPPMEEIFGNNADGSPRVVLHPEEPGKPKQDIVLGTCYRNSRPILSTAHAIGFGIYRDGGLVQIFEDSRLWSDVGYKIERGDLTDGKSVELTRTPESSPEFLEKHSAIDDLISFEVFDTEEEQTARVVEEIIKNLEDDELLPEDIMVINPDPSTTRHAVGEARSRLLERGVNSNVAGTDSADIFTEPGKVTFTGIFRAKGNEAGMVYIINAQDCFTAPLRHNIASVRNRLFTAITRSNAWVRVFGTGPNMKALKDEFEKVKEAGFALRFTYPTEEERKRITIINRDMSTAEKKQLENNQRTIEAFTESLESGKTRIEDYPESVIEKLRSHLNKKSLQTR